MTVSIYLTILTIIFYCNSNFYCPCPHVVILVGFEKDLLSANESDGSVELCVRIFTDPTLFPNHTEINFFLNLISTTGSASKIVILCIILDTQIFICISYHTNR